MPGLDTEQGDGLAGGNVDTLRNQMRGVANMLGAEMRILEN